MNLYRSTIYISSVVCLSIFFSCNGDGKQKSSKISKSTPGTLQIPEILPHALPEEFYMRLEGEIGGQAVVMNLQRDKSEFYGNYYYQGSWLTLSEMETSLKETFVFSESGFNLNDEERFIHLKWTGVGFVGYWTADNGRKSYPLILRESYPEGSFQFKHRIFKDSIQSVPGEYEKGMVEFQEQYIVADGNNRDYKWLDKVIKLRDRINGSQSWERGISKKSEGIMNALLDDLQDTLGADSALLHSNYFNMSKNTILYNERSFLVLEKNFSAYTGGLHPNYSTTMVCFDVKNKKLLHLKDILKADANLSAVLESCFREQYGLKKNQSLKEILFEEEIYENHNFYFNNNGLAFKYNTYEIAPYSEGEISIFLPFSKIRNMIQPTFLQRFDPS